MQFELTAPVAKALLEYLMKQPYGEVAGLISAIQGLKCTQDAPPPAKEVDTEKKVA